MIKLTIGENQGNQRLDRFLKKYLAKASLGFIYKLIRKDVKVNGKRKAPETILEVGDELVIYMSEEEVQSLQKEVKKVNAKKQFTVIYEDDNILIINKPDNLEVTGENSLTDIVHQKYSNYDFLPMPCHRLDRNTTGLVLFAKNQKFYDLIIKEQEESRFLKYYTAYCSCFESQLEKIDLKPKSLKTFIFSLFSRFFFFPDVPAVPFTSFMASFRSIP